jgi:hypothetical protein
MAVFFSSVRYSSEFATVFWVIDDKYWGGTFKEIRYAERQNIFDIRLSYNGTRTKDYIYLAVISTITDPITGFETIHK